MGVSVQVWASFFEISPLHPASSRALLLAQENWGCAERIWFLPYVTQMSCWRVNGFTECLIPAKLFNVVMVFHVLENPDGKRSIYPPLPGFWPKEHPFPWIPWTSQPLQPRQTAIPSPLYTQWLNVSPSVSAGPKSLCMAVPNVLDGQFGYQTAVLDLLPGGLIPTARPEDSRYSIGEVVLDSHTHRLIWPPRGMDDSPFVSLETEYEPLDETDIPQDSILNDDQTHPQFVWPGPFDVLFPTGGGIDLFVHHEKLRQCIAALKNGHREKVMREAETWVGHLTHAVEAPWDRAWFFPRVVADPEGVLWDIEGRYGYIANTIQEFLASKCFHDLRQTTIRVQRVQGWLGYCWWEFYQDLMRHEHIGECKECGHVIRGGHKDREMCMKQENPDCFRQRAKIRQRKSRAKAQ